MDWCEDRIGSAARGENPTVLAELASGYAVIGDVQFLPGYSVLLGKDPDAKALADMPRAERVRFPADVDLLASAVERACRAADPASRRVNIDILGNADAFVHAHIWPRYEWEPPKLIWRPVWLYSLDTPPNGSASDTMLSATGSPPSCSQSSKRTESTSATPDARSVSRFGGPGRSRPRNRNVASALSAEGPASEH